MTKATPGAAWPKAPPAGASLSPASASLPAAPDYHWLTGSFRDPALERRFLEACEGNFVRRDRYVAAIICCLECLLIGLDIHLLANYPEVLFWRLASRGTFILSLFIIITLIFDHLPISRTSQYFFLFCMLSSNSVMASYHHPALQGMATPGFLLAIYLFTITAYYTFLSPGRLTLLVNALLFGLQFVLLQRWFDASDTLFLYTPFLLFGLISFSHYTAVSQARQYRQVWLAAEEARLRQRRAEEAQGFRARLLELIGHDLRQPLSALCYYQTALRYQAEALEPRIARQLVRVSGQIDQINQQLSEMLTKALELAQLDYDALLARCLPQSVAPLAKDLRHQFAPLATREGIRLRLYGEDQHLMHDRALMAVVLRNLLSNALRYHARAAPRPRIILAFRRDGQRIEVIDNGGGMPTHFAAALDATPLRRQTDPSSRRGLGLSIARQFAARQGWQLELQNCPPFGVRARLRFSQALPPPIPTASH